jgi:SAM-dependent methyltransferase
VPLPPYAIARGPAPTAELAQRDAGLAGDLRERLRHDRRTEHLALEVDVAGAVAHVTGEVADDAERALVRRLLRGVAGVRAAWDLVWTPARAELAMADLGVGPVKQVQGALGIDCHPGPQVDLVADLEEGVPLGDDALDHVFAVHVLEHVRELVGLMADLHRVLRPTGVLHVLCPDWRHVHAVADPTHVRSVDARMFAWFCHARPGSPAWRPLAVRTDGITVHADLQPVKAGAAAPDAAELSRVFAR